MRPTITGGLHVRRPVSVNNHTSIWRRVPSGIDGSWRPFLVLRHGVEDRGAQSPDALRAVPAVHVTKKV